ncbi:hypothetical protein C499_12035 [Halogeometricum borinquense DSM 11551]|uniref:Uncharacterized protein n=1 Tax=Halogeometricum borinquense (strain ATCC 700274 / DSM 11551 / JCM 10706 / KCTC 4070 / PR3) TaxID=469382 RepID=E4NWQ4_HALBP|nr:hypothetical protein [Halogeometricum borinquense]ADQ69474.1 hypothetical protein Hbor_37680 [Halogeometricum borinquense DSM 11551]ELY26186.1 hypothetical protein C499_12035 [Halogeometricum borinquense DSM 11551]
MSNYQPHSVLNAEITNNSQNSLDYQVTYNISVRIEALGGVVG